MLICVAVHHADLLAAGRVAPQKLWGCFRLVHIALVHLPIRAALGGWFTTIGYLSLGRGSKADKKTNQVLMFSLPYEISKACACTFAAKRPGLQL